MQDFSNPSSRQKRLTSWKRDKSEPSTAQPGFTQPSSPLPKSSDDTALLSEKSRVWEYKPNTPKHKQGHTKKNTQKHKLKETHEEMCCDTQKPSQPQEYQAFCTVPEYVCLQSAGCCCFACVARLCARTQGRLQSTLYFDWVKLPHMPKSGKSSQTVVGVYM